MAAHTISQRLHNGDALLLDGGTRLGAAAPRSRCSSKVPKTGLKACRQRRTSNMPTWSGKCTQTTSASGPTSSPATTSGRRLPGSTLSVSAAPGAPMRPPRSATPSRPGNAMRQEAYVAGGIAAPSLQGAMSPTSLVSDVGTLGLEAYRREWADHAKLLADEGRRPDPSRVRRLHRGLRRGCRRLCRGGRAGFLGVRHIQATAQCSMARA